MSAKRYLLLVESFMSNDPTLRVLPKNGLPVSLKDAQRLSAVELATPHVSRCRIVEVVAEGNQPSPG